MNTSVDERLSLKSVFVLEKMFHLLVEIFDQRVRPMSIVDRIGEIARTNDSQTKTKTEFVDVQRANVEG